MLGKWKSDPDPCPESDQHQNLTASRELPLAHAYRIWSTSVNVLVTYLAHRHTYTNHNRVYLLRLYCSREDKNIVYSTDAATAHLSEAAI